MKYDILAIIGPTASGKTVLAAHVAKEIHAEIISGDSRQVYRRMDIGTGKDLRDYEVDGYQVPYHLIDIAEPGTKYNVFQFQQDFLSAYMQVTSRGRLPILCGGTGMYIEAVLRGYNMLPVPENSELRTRLSGKTLEELIMILKGYKKLHNTTDVDTVNRALRAIEIEEYTCTHPLERHGFPNLNALIIGVDVSREIRRERISRRLKQRIDEGMVDEIKGLLDEGIPAENLIYYGLEYKYLTLYATGRLAFDEMYKRLEIAIHQFAKRQMTWFRGMERRGLRIHWLDGNLPLEEKVKRVVEMLV